MTQRKFFNSARFLGTCATTLALSACGSSGGGGLVPSQAQALTAVCTTAAAPAPAGAWLCPDAKTLECNAAGGTSVDTLYVQDSTQHACSGHQLSVSEAGPFAVGPHSIVVTDTQSQTLCTAQLNVVDTQAPQLVEHTLNLWPPNHKLHGISVSDCVSAVDACEGELKGEFIWASSDEPVDSIGDGHFGPDIGFGPDSQHACVRAERQGPKDGRVYKLGVRIVDASGHAAEGACTIIVDHDQRGTVGKDSGEAYRVTFNGTQAGAACDGASGTGGSGGGAGIGGSAGGSGGAGIGGSAGVSGGAGIGGSAGVSGSAGSGAAGTSATPFGGSPE